jgi:hypothetical protein
MHRTYSHIEHETIRVPLAESADCDFDLQTRFGISSSPYSEAALNRTIAVAQVALERAFMQARVDAGSMATIELFALLAENAPEMLPAPWSTLMDIIAAEERLWVYPTATVAEIEEGLGAPHVPYLNRAKLASEWHCLLEHAQRVSEARCSGARHGLEA